MSNRESMDVKTAAMVAAQLAKTTADVTAGIMKELSDIKKDLAVNTIQTKNISDKMDEMRNDLSVQVRDHETRIRKLEFWGAMAVGGLFVIDAVIGWFIMIKK